MAGRGKVFISHAREDIARAASLVKWLSAWGVDYWLEAQAQESGQLAQNTQAALAESGVFLRICTPAANRSYWMSLELGAFLSLQADEQRRGVANRRLLVSLILDPDYQRQPFDHSNPIIDATTKPQTEWLSELRALLDLPPDPSLGQQEVAVAQVPVTRAGTVTMSRRRVLGTGIASAAALAVAGSTGLLLLERQRDTAHPLASATATVTSGPPPKVRDPKLAWWYKTGATIKAVPVLVNGTIYFGSNDQNIYALDAATGHVVWKDPSNAQFHYTPAVGTQLLFFTATSPEGGNSAMIGLDPKDGSQKWTIPLTFALGNPIAANGLVFSPYASLTYGVIAYRQDPNSTDTHDVWFADTTPLDSGNKAAVFAIALDNTTIYASSQGGSLYAFDASNADVNLPAGAAEAKAKLLWTYKTGGAIYGRAAVASGTVYAGSDDKHLHAIDAASGKRKWTFQAGDVVETTPAVANGVVYFGSTDTTFYALDASSGKQIWGLKTGGDLSSGVLSANTIYFVSLDKYLYAVDATSGKVLNKYQLANTPSIRPALGPGLVYTADQDGYLYAFKAL
jgi:outer membrane protein assembly factor BamB